MRVNVISLVRTPDRRERFAAQNAHIDYQFVDAVDGAAMSAQALSDTGLFAPDLNYGAGAYGCAMSHLQMWNQAIETGQTLTVAEDDAVFRFDFHAQHDALLTQMPKDWHIILWGWNFNHLLALNLMPGVTPVVTACNEVALKESIDTFRAMENTPTLMPLAKCMGTLAYTITPMGARRFRSMCFPMKPFDLPVASLPGMPDSIANAGLDVAMSRIYPMTDSRVCMPPLAVTCNHMEHSTIDPFPFAQSLAATLTWN